MLVLSRKNFISKSAAIIVNFVNLNSNYLSEEVFNTECGLMYLGNLSSSNMPTLRQYREVKVEFEINLSFIGLNILKSSQISSTLVALVRLLTMLHTSLFQFNKSSIDLLSFWIFSTLGILIDTKLQYSCRYTLTWELNLVEVLANLVIRKFVLKNWKKVCKILLVPVLFRVSLIILFWYFLHTNQASISCLWPVH